MLPFQNAANCKTNDDIPRAFVRLLTCFDTRDHVRLGFIDQLIGQTLETVGQGCSLCCLQLSCLRGTAGTNQFHDLRDDFDEPVVVLTELAEQFDFVLGYELRRSTSYPNWLSCRSVLKRVASSEASMAAETL